MTDADQWIVDTNCQQLIIEHLPMTMKLLLVQAFVKSFSWKHHMGCYVDILPNNIKQPKRLKHGP